MKHGPAPEIFDQIKFGAMKKNWLQIDMETLPLIAAHDQAKAAANNNRMRSK